ncbi:trophoblast glycoprotein isoform X1 [Sphaerodactylus townsendi]|uniref:trophoblast glycoprotein isoform X1 n=1 Tax=Sphaerodactylus townsendi TaxID=933632 RepID=UPI00202639E9|nr:trophoblast glycoprotein isoform X1 [Sphaerodactylus townsendi]
MLGCSLWGSAPPTPVGERRRRAVLLEGLLLVVVFPIQVSTQQLTRCPEACNCSEVTRTVTCINQSLTEVPRDLPHYVRDLLLAGNCITGLQPGTFFSEPPLQLSHLSLSSNCLEWVGDDALAGLPSLKQVDLSHNRLSSFSAVAFGNSSSLIEEVNLSNSLSNTSNGTLLAELLPPRAFPNLKFLDLSDNRLLRLPVDMFSSLFNLQHLNLQNSSLSDLYKVDFSNLHQLQSLDLSDNALKCLMNSTIFQLRSLPRLSSLDLSHNSWVCDCQIEVLVNWLKESDLVVAKETLKCSDSNEMGGRPLVTLDFADLDCPVPTDDQTQLQTSYVFLGIVLALIGAVFLLVLYLNRKGIKKWMYNIRDACRDHMEGYHYRYEINADPRLTNLSSNSDV